MFWDFIPSDQNRPVDLVASIQRHRRWGQPDFTFLERSLTGIDTILVHHAASSPQATPADVARWHVEENGWPGPGYHLIIDYAGTAYKVNLDKWACYHAYRDNWTAIGICLTGDFRDGRLPSAAQLVTLTREIRRYQGYAGIRYLGGHRHGRDTRNRGTSCPGDEMLPILDFIRRQVNLQPVP